MNNETGDKIMNLSKTATSQDVAKLAGVSQSAVSRCFTKGASISSRTKLRVLEAARKLKYKALYFNFLAASRTLSFVLLDILAPFVKQRETAD